MRPAAELLLIESRTLPAILARQPADALDRPTALPGWRVRDVVAHCGAALRRLVDGRDLEFTPEANWADIEERRSWPFELVLVELLDAYPAAAAAIDAAGGAFDGLGLGEWIHGGDLREPLGEPGAYGGPGIALAIPLLIARSVAWEVPAVRVDLRDRTFRFGVGEPKARLRTDPVTFVRLCAGRGPNADDYELFGAEPDALRLFF